MTRMARWEPNARERLVDAALQLFQERGYSRTTVGEIAARAGLTERTFFRYFADKREVLFGGSRDLEKGIADAIAAAPEDTSPLEVVVGALETIAAAFPPRRDYRARQRLIAAHPELRERELIKLASLTSAIGGALRARGVAEAAASLTAEAGIAIFKTAYERWVGGTRQRDFAAHIRAALDELRAVTAVASSPRTPARAATSRRQSLKPLGPSNDGRLK
jgi:AcrR family transcriptional regulator